MWYLSQLGRREHYAFPCYLHEQGKLGMFATDVWCSWAGRSPHGLLPRKLAQRYNPKLNGAPIVSLGFVKSAINALSRQQDGLRWVREGRQFGAFVAAEFAKTALGAGDVILGYTAANLEQLKLGANRSAIGLHVQVDPGQEWYLTRQSEQRAFPEVEDELKMPDGSFFDRIQEEWAQATKVIVHSEHSKRALAGQGVGADKITVVPPAFDPLPGGLAKRRKRGRPLRVLFVGNHCLAKGFHYYAQAAATAPSGIEFHSAGRILLKDAYRSDVAKHVHMHGHLAQADVWRLMENSDVLVFPTLSDGFGLVQLEAMSLGLPVISTVACGGVVRDGIDGLKIPSRDHDAINAALIRLMEAPDLQATMSVAALGRSADFSTKDHYAALANLL